MKHLFSNGATMWLKLFTTHFCLLIKQILSWLSLPESQRQEAQLRAMSDVELRDLGLGRSEIPALLTSEVPQDVLDIWGNRYTGQYSVSRDTISDYS